MISNLKELIIKTSELEEKLELMENKSNQPNNVYSSFFNRYNLSIINCKKINIVNVKNNKEHLNIKLEIHFLLSSDQDIEFALFVNDVEIKRNTHSCMVGNNTMNFNENFQDYLNYKLNISFICKPLSFQQVTITSTNLTIVGLSQESNNEYDAVETNNSIVASTVINNQLFIKTISKNDINKQDFHHDVCYINAISHSLLYDENNDLVYLFYIDLQSNLFCLKLSDNSSIFISNNTSKVSSCYHSDKIIFSYISKGKCYLSEIVDGNIHTSTINQLYGEFIGCYLYSNSDKAYLILTKEDGSNYLLENINSTFSNTENLNAQISLSITTYEANDEN